MIGQGARSTSLQMMPSWKGLRRAINIASAKDRADIQTDHDIWKSEPTGWSKKKIKF